MPEGLDLGLFDASAADASDVLLAWLEEGAAGTKGNLILFAIVRSKALRWLFLKA